MNATTCRLIAAVLTLFFSIATLGKTGSYIDATECAAVLYGLWLLGKMCAQAKGGA